MARAGAALLLALLLAGCTGGAFAVARVPANLLQGGNGNGWATDAPHSQAAPTSDGGVQRQTLAYADDGTTGDKGYPATLSLTTLKLFPTPTETQLRDLLQQQVKQHSEQSGITVGNQVVEGGRNLADGHHTLYFVFTGTLTGTGPLFTTRDATAKILGEVWNCPEKGTSVAAVGLAQVSSVQSVGGVPISKDTNTGNWREIAADPAGAIDGQRGADGLVANVACAA